MKRMPSVKEIVRFALLTTPAIWIILFVIQEAIKPLPVFRSPVGLRRLDRYTRVQEPQIAVIDTLLPVTEGFQSVAKDTRIESATMSPENGVIDYRCCIVGTILPCGLTQEEVDANLRAVARHTFEDGARNVRVVAYSSTRPYYSSVVPIATLTFAPYGDWDRTDRIYNIEEYETVISRHSPDLTESTSRTKSGLR